MSPAARLAALRGSGALAVRPERTRGGLWRIATCGAARYILNPKLSLFFLALLPPVLSGDPARATAEMPMSGTVCKAMTFAVFVVCGLFAAALHDRVPGDARVMRWRNRAFAGVFAALAGRFALERA